MNWRKAIGIAFVLLTINACSHLSKDKKTRVDALVQQQIGDTLDCQAKDDCALLSPLYDLADTAYQTSSPQKPRHAVILLDGGQDSLAARLHLIHSAKHSIELQMFIFDQDDAGQLTLLALMDAARRGVKVRVLLDQQYGLDDPVLQAFLAHYHRNFELRLYNPLFDEAHTRDLEFIGGIFFTFRSLNQRMHSKLLLVDDKLGIIGGRNIQDRYFEWSIDYNYRDRDVLIAGPATQKMKANFDAFWWYRKSLPPQHLKDVAQVLLNSAGHIDEKDLFFSRPLSARALQMDASAHDSQAIMARLQPHLFWVDKVDFLADLPSKHDDANPGRTEASEALYGLVKNSQQSIVLQTPYLVLSRSARKVFKELHRKANPAVVKVSTNSLASTDAFPVYAMSHKYKRMYLRELGFEIQEFKPYPAESFDDIATAADTYQDADSDDSMPIVGSHLPGSHAGVAPLKRAGTRIGLHAKSMVVDGNIAVVGSHNFDPRSDYFNTENLAIIPDTHFAQALAASIGRDMRPENSWTIAPRPKPPILSGLNYNLGKFSEALPIFDVWPFPYATSYQIKEGCEPMKFSNPKFQECYQQVGDFPEVDLSLKAVYTRMITAFGSGLMPIL